MQLFARARLCKGMMLQDCQTLNDEQVVERVRAGEIGLYELLMRRYNQRVYRVVRSVLMNNEDAEDVLQEAWVRAYEHLKQFRGLASFSTWVTKIAFYEALARAKKKKRWMPLEDPEGVIMPEAERRQPPTETPEAQAMRAQLGRMLEAAVDELPESVPLRVRAAGGGTVEHFGNGGVPWLVGRGGEDAPASFARPAAAGSGRPYGSSNCGGAFLYGSAV